MKIADFLTDRLKCLELRFILRVRLHVTEMKSHPRMKKFLFTREFHRGMKRVEFHPGMNFNLKENLPFDENIIKFLIFLNY